MDPTTSTFISVGEEEERKAYKHTRAGDKEGREDDEAYKRAFAWKPGETAGGRTPAHQLPGAPCLGRQRDAGRFAPRPKSDRTRGVAGIRKHMTVKR